MRSAITTITYNDNNIDQSISLPWIGKAIISFKSFIEQGGSIATKFVPDSLLQKILEPHIKVFVDGLDFPFSQEYHINIDTVIPFYESTLYFPEIENVDMTVVIGDTYRMKFTIGQRVHYVGATEISLGRVERIPARQPIHVDFDFRHGSNRRLHRLLIQDHKEHQFLAGILLCGKMKKNLANMDWL